MVVMMDSPNQLLILRFPFFSFRFAPSRIAAGAVYLARRHDTPDAWVRVHVNSPLATQSGVNH